MARERRPGALRRAVAVMQARAAAIARGASRNWSGCSNTRRSTPRARARAEELLEARFPVTAAAAGR